MIVYSSYKLAEVDRLQAAVGPRRVRRRGHALRALAAHLAPGHRPLQQVSCPLHWSVEEMAPFAEGRILLPEGTRGTTISKTYLPLWVSERLGESGHRASFTQLTGNLVLKSTYWFFIS